MQSPRSIAVDALQMQQAAEAASLRNVADGMGTRGCRMKQRCWMLPIQGSRQDAVWSINRRLVSSDEDTIALHWIMSDGSFAVSYLAQLCASSYNDIIELNNRNMSSLILIQSGSYRISRYAGTCHPCRTIMNKMTC